MVLKGSLQDMAGGQRTVYLKGFGSPDLIKGFRLRTQSLYGEAEKRRKKGIMFLISKRPKVKKVPNP